MQRYGMMIGLNPEQADEYKRLHAAVWPEVLRMIGACHIRNYSIFLREPENIMFSYIEYHGSDCTADMGTWRLTPTRKAGGNCAAPANGPWKPARKENGGRRWPKCSTAIRQRLEFNGRGNRSARRHRHCSG